MTEFVAVHGKQYYCHLHWFSIWVTHSISVMQWITILILGTKDTMVLETAAKHAGSPFNNRHNDCYLLIAQISNFELWVFTIYYYYYYCCCYHFLERLKQYNIPTGKLFGHMTQPHDNCNIFLTTPFSWIWLCSQFNFYIIVRRADQQLRIFIKRDQLLWALVYSWKNVRRKSSSSKAGQFTSKGK